MREEFLIITQLNRPVEVKILNDKIHVGHIYKADRHFMILEIDPENVYELVYYKDVESVKIMFA